MAPADAQPTKRPLITIVIPTLNAIGKLPPTIESITSQEFGDWECIVVDGGSTDGTIEYLDGLDERFRWVSLPKSKVYPAMNHGASLTTGRFLYFFCAGDRLRPGALAAVAPHLTDDFGWVYGDIYSERLGRDYDGKFTKAKLSTGNNICHQAIFCGREAFNNLGGLRPDIYWLYADYYLNILAFDDPRVHVKYVPVTVAIYEKGGGSDQWRDERFLADFPQLIRKHLGWHLYVAYKLRMAVPPSLKRIARKLIGKPEPPEIVPNEQNKGTA